MNAKEIKKMILSGDITTFTEVVSCVGLKRMSEVLDCSVQHVGYIIDHPGKMLLGEFFRLCEWLEMGREEVGGLFKD